MARPSGRKFGFPATGAGRGVIMFKKLLGFSLLVFAFPAFAGDLSYNLVELGYLKHDTDEDLVPGTSIDGDGFGVRGSFELGESWFIGVNYSKIDFNVGIDYDQMGAGIGWHTGLSNNTDFYAMLQYVRAEASVSGISVDEDGVGATIGVRGMLTDKVELGGSIGYVDLGDAGDGTAFGAHVMYNFTDNFAAGLLLGVDEDLTSYGAGIRLYW